MRTNMLATGVERSYPKVENGKRPEQLAETCYYQNNNWSALFADYAEAFARRYTWIAYCTPVNE